MPLYEYRCLDCGREVEVIQKLSDDPLVQCSACGGRLEKLLSAPAIQFKGSGWYITDYARKNSPQSNGSSNKEEKSSSKESTSTSTSDVKTSSAK